MTQPIGVLLFCAALAAASPQESAPSAEQPANPPLKSAEPPSAEHKTEVLSGTRIPLSLINTVSSKHSVEGDRVYLETVFPIIANGRVAIPPGSYVAGTVTSVKRAGRIKGRAELYVRFDSLTLPNGVTRDFRARLGSVDGRSGEELDRSEGKVKGEGNKGGDARTVGEAASAGTTIGVIAGSVNGRPGMGAGIGAAAGAAAGLMGVLLTRGPDAALSQGSTVEMVLDRSLYFTDTELDFGPAGPMGAGRRYVSVPGAAGQRQRQGLPLPGRGGPL